jgi:hypothetical protein
MVAENQGLNEDDVVKTKDEIKELANDPVKQQLDKLAMQKATLENQEISAKIDKEHAEIEKIDAAIDNDEELMRLKALELQGKEVEAAAMLRLKEKEIDATIAQNKVDASRDTGTSVKKKPKTAGAKKTTVGATRKQSKNDGLKTNN